MRKQIFLTLRDEPLPNWRTAFPEAEIRAYPRHGERITTQPGRAVLWLHLGNDHVSPAARVGSMREAAPGCPLLVLSNVPNDEEGLAVLEAGAVGYTSSLAVPELMRQIDTVVENGGLWVGPELLQRLLAALAARAAGAQSPQRLSGLSPRELQVAQAVARGASNKEIARELDITERTVKAHLSAIFQQLGVRDRLQLSILVNGLPPARPPVE